MCKYMWFVSGRQRTTPSLSPYPTQRRTSCQHGLVHNVHNLVLIRSFGIILGVMVTVVSYAVSAHLSAWWLPRGRGDRRLLNDGTAWSFEQEEEGVILEDDCLPHPDLFRFCDSLLARYRNDPRVWIITSDNFRRGDASYYSSKYNHCWGWASWRRPWKHYDGDIASVSYT